MCLGSGTGFFLRNKDGASTSIVVTEVRVSVVRTPTLGVWCVPELLFSSSLSRSRTWYVDSSEVSDSVTHYRDFEQRGDTPDTAMTTIQHAINHAIDGDVVKLLAQTYTDVTSSSVLRCSTNMIVDSSAESDGSLSEWKVVDHSGSLLSVRVPSTTKTPPHSGSWSWKFIFKGSRIQKVLGCLLDLFLNYHKI